MKSIALLILFVAAAVAYVVPHHKELDEFDSVEDIDHPHPPSHGFRPPPPFKHRHHHPPRHQPHAGCHGSHDGWEPGQPDGSHTGSGGQSPKGQGGLGGSQGGTDNKGLGVPGGQGVPNPDGLIDQVFGGQGSGSQGGSGGQTQGPNRGTSGGDQTDPGLGSQDLEQGTGLIDVRRPK